MYWTVYNKIRRGALDYVGYHIRFIMRFIYDRGMT